MLLEVLIQEMGVVSVVLNQSKVALGSLASAHNRLDELQAERHEQQPPWSNLRAGPSSGPLHGDNGHVPNARHVPVSRSAGLREGQGGPGRVFKD